MKKISLLILLALMLAACQLVTVAPTTTPPPAIEKPANPTATSAPTIVTPATEKPPPPEDIFPALPFAPGAQPNGSFVVQEIQRADLTGDGRAEFIVSTGWKENEVEEFAVPLQVDIITAAGTSLYTQNTWESFGLSPSTMELAANSLFIFDRIEAVDIVSLTGEAPPQVVVRIRYSGTGAILEAHVLSFEGGTAQSLEDITAYKGGMDYHAGGFTVIQPLYLYNEPNCCPCRMETATYTWDGAAFAVTATLREEIAEMEGCPAFPVPAAWRALAAAGPLPPARRDAALVYDASRSRLLLFGGRQGANALNDTWAFDLETNTWTEIVLPGAPRPPARYSMVAGLDATRNQLVITTGEARPGAFFNDVWTLNLQTDTWAQQQPTGALPAVRYGAAGGIPEYSNTLILTHGFTDQGRFDDTWILDLETLSWRNVTPAGALPLKRCLHGAAPVGWTRLALFGGCSSPFGPCPQGDTWILDLLKGEWRAVADPGPSSREYTGMTTLSDRSAVLLFGGLGAGNTELGDVWILDPIQGGWRQVMPGNAGPSPRQGHSMAWMGYSPLTPGGAVAVFGGLSGGTMRNDLWLFTPGDE